MIGRRSLLDARRDERARLVVLSARTQTPGSQNVQSIEMRVLFKHLLHLFLRFLDVPLIKEGNREEGLDQRVLGRERPDSFKLFNGLIVPVLIAEDARAVGARNDYITRIKLHQA